MKFINPGRGKLELGYSFIHFLSSIKSGDAGRCCSGSIYRRTRRPADTAPLSVIEPGGPGLSETPSLAGIGSEFALKCHFCRHDQGWMMKKGKNQNKG
jgi:hypothetical protein